MILTEMMFGILRKYEYVIPYKVLHKLEKFTEHLNQVAYNLAWNRPLSQKITVYDICTKEEIIAIREELGKLFEEYDYRNR